MVGFVRVGFRYADVIDLIIGQLDHLRIELLQLQACDFLVFEAEGVFRHVQFLPFLPGMSAESAHVITP